MTDRSKFDDRFVRVQVAIHIIAAPPSSTSSPPSSPPSPHPPTDRPRETPQMDEFKSLLDGRLVARRLFKSIADQLANTRHIGRKHSLYAEWEGLERCYEELEEEVRSNAEDCVSCMTIHRDVVIPLTELPMPIKEKQEGINQFLKSLGRLRQGSKSITKKLADLRDEIEAFPPKVSKSVDASRPWYERWFDASRPWYERWFDVLRSLVTRLLQWFAQLAKKADPHRANSGTGNVNETNVVRPEEPLLWKHQENNNDYENLSDALLQLKLAWSMMRQSCDTLHHTLGLAADNSHREKNAKLCDVFLQAAGLYLKQSREYAELFAAEVTE
ncbi:hypothetical protein POSPLADRAFT_1031429 [Postia placenta MAD-698-R-SB12]|uniref:Uncharacterized protein n=1 Tax=Postia placenta MAD-698-R-SB12 TaxID=670580 RepID=A0A1X6NDD3_9APHY|nr:hypothetical protein POSPLADRAFT_1031429 [Postia placenta MAD-698-R-SB12]OSX66393.1 hypothetical protein POSPLADRAFT_1031429 [Postia placenta MAD-698-R-SB12]